MLARVFFLAREITFMKNYCIQLHYRPTKLNYDLGIAAVSRDHFLELTDYTEELAPSSTGSTSEAPELV